MEPQLIVSVPIISRLNPKSQFIRCEGIYILLVAIRPSDGNVKPGAPLVFFDNTRLMPAPSFSHQPSSSHFHHSYIITQYNIYVTTYVFAVVK